jgi:hypothetical protein
VPRVRRPGGWGPPPSPHRAQGLPMACGVKRGTQGGSVSAVGATASRCCVSGHELPAQGVQAAARPRAACKEHTAPCGKRWRFSHAYDVQCAARWPMEHLVNRLVELRLQRWGSLAGEAI